MITDLTNETPVPVSAAGISLLNDIKLGINTNNLLAAKRKVSPESICAQLRKLRREKVLITIARRNPGNINSTYLEYYLTDKKYVMLDKRIGNQKRHFNRNALIDEPKYSCLDEYLYKWPAKNGKQL